MPTVRAPITCSVTVNRKNIRRFRILEKVGEKRAIAEKSTGAESRDCRKSRFIRYLRDRGCGDRWDRSTSHRKQRKRKPKLRIASHCHTVTPKKHTARSPSLVTFQSRYFRKFENYTSVGTIQAARNVDRTISGRGTFCRRPRSSVALRFLGVFHRPAIRISKGPPRERILGTS